MHRTAAGPFAAMTALDPRDSVSLDGEAMSREGRSVLSRHEIGGAPAIRLQSRPDKPRRSSCSVPITTEMDFSNQFGYHFRPMEDTIREIPV